MPRTKRKWVKSEWGEQELKWVQITKSGRKKPSQNRLRAKTMWGYSHEDYKEWGQQGGRPLKWNSEAERKRWARQQKAIAEGRELREYKKQKKLISEQN